MLNENVINNFDCIENVPEIIKTKDSTYEKLSFFEKYFKMRHDERQKFLKVAVAGLVPITMAAITLVINFPTHSNKIIIGGMVVWIIFLLGYFFYIKNPIKVFGLVSPSNVNEVLFHLSVFQRG